MHPDLPASSARAPARARHLVEDLELQRHPEGGWYREVFRSSGTVQPSDGRGARQAMTSIYFLLESGRHSRWHCVASDEAWVHLEGTPLDLWTWSATTGQMQHHRLGPLLRAPQTEPQYVVPAGVWQAASAVTDGDEAGYSLVACTVGPGFDFSDFRMMTPGDAESARLAREHPALAYLV